jgi:predicted enzyme related to lactoylglutathione lyase
MMTFFQITLRTTDVQSATAFYSGVLGLNARLDVVPLHEQAIARGARPHWLGFLDVGDVERVGDQFVQRGATTMGPKWINPQGLEAQYVRDPGGAMVALAKPPPTTDPAPSGVVWYLLNTADVARAKVNYGQLFGWEFQQPNDLGPLGTLHPFAWAPGGSPVGAMVDAQGRPGVHAHWLFYFGVASVESAVSAIQSLGGQAELISVPNGEKVALCHDPQGAAFGVRQTARTA